MVGTTIEFFDFYIYATAAVFVFLKLFFPSGKSDGQPLGVVRRLRRRVRRATRRLGAVRAPGDRIGRKATLVGSLLTMGIATFVIGLLPTYESIGYAAPILLAVLRFCQGSRARRRMVEWRCLRPRPPRRASAGGRRCGSVGAPLGFPALANGVFLR